jgi:hypothetical protein
MTDIYGSVYYRHRLQKNTKFRRKDQSLSSGGQGSGKPNSDRHFSNSSSVPATSITIHYYNTLFTMSHAHYNTPVYTSPITTRYFLSVTSTTIRQSLPVLLQYTTLSVTSVTIHWPLSVTSLKIHQSYLLQTLLSICDVYNNTLSLSVSLLQYTTFYHSRLLQYTKLNQSRLLQYTIVRILQSVTLTLPDTPQSTQWQDHDRTLKYGLTK